MVGLLLLAQMLIPPEPFSVGIPGKPWKGLYSAFRFKPPRGNSVIVGNPETIQNRVLGGHVHLKVYAENFVDSVRKKEGVTLDYTLSSLALASAVALDYGEIYRNKSELKDPRMEAFFVEAVYQLTGYFGEVYCRHFGASWIIKDDPDDVLIQVGKAELPLYRDACDTLKLGNGALTRRFLEVEEAAGDLLRATPSGIEKSPAEIAHALQCAHKSVKAGIEEAAAMAVQDVKAMLKQDLDGTPATFLLLEEALLRLRAMISSAPEQKSAIVKASVKKYGAPILEKHCARNAPGCGTPGPTMLQPSFPFSTWALPWYSRIT